MSLAVRHPLYFAGGAGRCYATLFQPKRSYSDRLGGAERSGVVFVPPFAEEMNKARRMAALAGAAVAEAGHPALLPDLWGTGDSEGDFADARWEIWLDDLRAAVGVLRDRGVAAVDLVALRLGALLASELAADSPVRVRRLVFWQPVVSGRQYLTQFLRLRVASALAGGGGETVRTIREELDRAGAVEIAGYELSLPLATSIDAAALASATLPRSAHATWIDVSNNPDRPLAPVAQSVVDGWRGQGLRVEVERVQGDAFWATQEITEVPQLVYTTVRTLARVAD